jgi:hypothetical protein
VQTQTAEFGKTESDSRIVEEVADAATPEDEQEYSDED